MPHLHRDWAHPCRTCTGTVPLRPFTRRLISTGAGARPAEATSTPRLLVGRLCSTSCTRCSRDCRSVSVRAMRCTLHVACCCNVGQCSAARCISLRACTARPDSTAGKRHAQRKQHPLAQRARPPRDARPRLGHSGCALRCPRGFGSAGRLTGPVVGQSLRYLSAIGRRSKPVPHSTHRAGGRAGGRAEGQEGTRVLTAGERKGGFHCNGRIHPCGRSA